MPATWRVAARTTRPSSPIATRISDRSSIGTVGNRTLLHLHLDDEDTRVVELLWLELHGAWRIHDARVFSLLPGE
jgi:hypothetical protein